MWYTNLLIEYPPPWKFVDEAGRCGNGSRIDAIVDANDNAVLTNYGSSWTLLRTIWQWYKTLTEDDLKLAKLELLRVELNKEIRKGDEDNPRLEELNKEIDALDPNGYTLCESLNERENHD